MTLVILSLAGGLFALLAFVHFFVDWIFQTHSEAMVKHNHPWIRAKHCFIYTVGFIPVIYFLHYSIIEWIVGLNILFWSHFIEDTYLPVFLWAKYIRRPAEMTEPWNEIQTQTDGSTIITTHPPDARYGFSLFIQTPIGKILMIAIDQIIHLTFLFPLVWMALN